MISEVSRASADWVRTTLCALVAALVSVMLFAMLGQRTADLPLGAAGLSTSGSGQPRPFWVRLDTQPDGMTMHQAARAEPATGTVQSMGYLSPEQLTQRPQLLQDMDSELMAPGLAPLQINAVLLINEYGDVDRAVFDSYTLPAYLEVVLAERFRTLRFTPGSLQGVAVRSALRIEISVQPIASPAWGEPQ
jgi:hypothetical protein